MPVSGLVLTLSPDPGLRALALEALARDPRVTVGERIGARLPVVTETDTLLEHHALWSDLEAIDGVLLVQLAFHDFSDVAERDLDGGRRGGVAGG
jgi:hypothetical protein